jgi:hypothetical protein
MRHFKKQQLTKSVYPILLMLMDESVSLYTTILPTICKHSVLQMDPLSITGFNVVFGCYWIIKVVS